MVGKLNAFDADQLRTGGMDVAKEAWDQAYQGKSWPGGVLRAFPSIGRVIDYTKRFHAIEYREVKDMPAVAALFALQAKGIITGVDRQSPMSAIKIAGLDA
jgi:tryptophan synthase beta subunit